jgi:hypothetical protein
MKRCIDSVERTRLWRQHVERWQQQGLTQSEYCRRNALALSTFQLWRRRLAAAAPDFSASDAANCVELVALPRAIGLVNGPVQGHCAVVVYVGSYRLEVNEGTDGSTLRTVIDVLEAR